MGLLAIISFTILPIIFLLSFIVFCSTKKKKKYPSNEITQSSSIKNNNNNNDSIKSLKFIPVKVVPPSRSKESSKRNKKCLSAAPSSTNSIKIQKLKKLDTTKEKSSDFVKTKTTAASTKETTKNKETVTCEMDGFQSERPTTTTEENTVVQNNATTDTTGGYDNLTVPSEKDKEKEKIDTS
uniref:Uncharacterized protein n=1 Tax=Panagrolaimus davidi TaxID=227884 RepID=A0A914QYC0_9BILA